MKRYGYFLHPLDDRHGMSPEAFGQTSRYCCRNSSEKLQQDFVIIKGKKRDGKLPSESTTSNVIHRSIICIFFMK